MEPGFLFQWKKKRTKENRQVIPRLIAKMRYNQLRIKLILIISEESEVSVIS
jgi:hypothetical protein